MDYAAWTRRARDLTLDLPRRLGGTLEMQSALVEAPLTAEQEGVLERELDLPIPPPLKNFLTTASAGCRCKYWWEPPRDDTQLLREIFPGQGSYIYGGASLCHARTMHDDVLRCRDWARTCKIIGTTCDEPEHRLWSHALPFLAVGNGDYIAFDMIDPRAADPPILYLVHDEESPSRPVARSFDHFLQDWEVLCYVGPEIWLIQEFFDQRGLLSTSGGKVRDLHRLFQLGL